MQGHIIEPRAIVLRKSAGTLQYGGSVYFIGTCPDGAPIIQSTQSGAYWRINWQRLIEMAIAEGIDCREMAQGGPDDAA